MKQNDFTAIDAQDSLSELIKQEFDLDVDLDCGNVTMRATDENDDLTF